MDKKSIFIAVILALFFVGLLTLLKLYYYPSTNVLGARNWNRRRPVATPTVKLTVSSITPTIVASVTTLVTSVTPTPTAKPTNSPTPRPTNTPVATPTTGLSQTKMKWGYYTGWSTAQVKDLESRVGKVGNFLATFVHWGNENELPLELANLAKSRGQTLVIFWEAMDYNFNGVNDVRFNYDSILRGDWNNYLTSFANQTRSFGGQVILIPFEEMNGNWYPWAGTVNNNTPAKHVAAFRYIRNYFKDIPNVKFAWTINSDSDPNVPGNQYTDYYPGDEYVDIVGTNGFNFGSPWMSFAQVFASGLSKLETMNKPIIIFSTASAQGTEKGNWIRTGLGQEVYKHPKLEGWIWFNENKEKNWLIWSSADSLDAFKSVVQ